MGKTDTSKDPEQLIAEALRARANRGSLGTGPVDAVRRAEHDQSASLYPLRWLVLVAALLGLATGAVIGLITLL